MKSLFLILCHIILIVEGIRELADKSNQYQTKPDFNRYGPFIVHLDRDITSHKQFEQQVQNFVSRNEQFMKFRPVITHYYSNVIHGVTIEGINSEDLQSFNGVIHVHPVQKKRIRLSRDIDIKDKNNRNVFQHPISTSQSIHNQTSAKYSNSNNIQETIYSWGLDRINQASLPLDLSCASDYDGSGVDVYIVDTGLDTTHQEFNNNDVRHVQNIFSSFSSNKNNPGSNTDDVGHGTHVAGTVGRIILCTAHG
jgi:hypothetical protein